MNKNDFNKCPGKVTELGISIPDFLTRDWNDLKHLGFLVNKRCFYDTLEFLGEEQMMLRKYYLPI